MARENKPSNIFILLALLLLVSPFLGSMLSATEARPLEHSSLGYSNNRETKNFFDGLFIGAVKESGPSPGGGGHRVKNLQTFGGIKDSGPGPARPLEHSSLGYSNNRETKNFFDGLFIGAVKESGPSPGGGGHIVKNLQTFGRIKDSGPGPGEGH
ncbi:hypothetical protein L1049_014995 [Liquidambar formosana]|uniref:Transmembrane protein n=1 Tax=Liquidambar formosana TaxID=63359 RepID=A0AAP0S449_LIQFO